MHFVWFWTFWHWSKESFRQGSLLRSPLHGIGSHWDEWFRHEASDRELKAIEESGRTEARQRQFVTWLFRHWAREIEWRDHRTIPRFVLSQLAQVPPFKQWAGLEKYRTRPSLAGVAALVLAEDSPGQADDVRTVAAVALPDEPTGQAVVSEGFQTEATELAAARSAARSLLRGKGLLIFLGLWIIGGRRPYPRWWSIALLMGWAAVLGLILFLWLGPEPGEQLRIFSAALAALWGGLILAAAVVVARQCFRAWRVGGELSTRLEHSQVRLRLPGGLTLKGGSAGLPFCLNTLLALYGACPQAVRDSWLWQRFFRRMRANAGCWAGTGVVTADGYLKPVVIEPKLRACLKHGRITQILTPYQSGVSQPVIDRLAKASTPTAKKEALAAFPSSKRLGYAAERPQLSPHRCRHVAQAMMALGQFTYPGQMATNLLALTVSTMIFWALPDLRSILWPHLAPTAVPPASSSPYDLWVSLNTKHPEYFSVVLESGYWSNRRAEVKRYGGPTPSVRAEIHFHRLTGRTTANEDDGDVWIERRRRFLTREFNPGERVGHYSIPYLSHLGHE
jgi:hypothetical protein